MGLAKEETLKRRKYDAINILEKADIIQTIKRDGTFIYTMKHDVPNSIKDLEQVKEKVNEQSERIRIKKEKLNMLKKTSSNYRKLI